MEKNEGARMTELRLSDLRNGESGTITSVGIGRGRQRRDNRGSGLEMRGAFHPLRHRHHRDWGFRKRLEDMGLTPGTTVTVVKSAPLNGPLEVRVRDSRLAIGRGMAERIFVEVKR